MLRSICAFFALLFVLALPSLSTSCAEPINPSLDVTQYSDTLVVRQAGQPARAGQSQRLTVKRRFPGGQLEDVTTRVV